MLNIKQAIVLFCIALFSAIAFAEESAVDPAIACFNALSDKPELNIIRDKIALVDVRDQTLEMLSSESKPKKAEKAAISVWVSEIDKCLSSSKQWHQNHYPASQISSIDQFFLATKLQAADLYAGKITYGVFAKNRAAIASKLDSELVEINQTIREQQRRTSDAVELKNAQERQAAAEERRTAHIELTRRQENESARQQQAEQFEQNRAEEERTRRNNFIMNMMRNNNNNQNGYQIVQPRSTNCQSTINGYVVSTHCQ